MNRGKYCNFSFFGCVLGAPLTKKGDLWPQTADDAFRIRPRAACSARENSSTSCFANCGSQAYHSCCINGNYTWQVP